MAQKFETVFSKQLKKDIQIPLNEDGSQLSDYDAKQYIDNLVAQQAQPKPSMAMQDFAPQVQSKNYLQAQIQPLINRSEKVAETAKTVYPRLSEMSPDAPFGQRFSSSIQDILSLPGRVGASVGGQALNLIQNKPTDFRSLPKQIQQTGSKESIVGDIIRSPSTIPSLAIPISKIPQGASALMKAGILAGQGAKVGATVGGIDQLENVSQGKSINPLGVAKETAFGAVLNPALGGVLSGLAKVPGMTAKGLAAVSQKLSTPGEFQKVKPALEAFGWGGKGSKAKEIIENAGEEKSLEIGQKIVNTAKNIAKGEVENKAIKEAILKMPPIKTKSTIDEIFKQKFNPEDYGGSLEPWQIKINNELDGVAKRLSINESMTAEQFLNKRKVIDKGINFELEGYDVASEFAKKMQNVRKAMKNELVDQAYYSGNDKYISNMKKWSNNIKAAEDFLNAPGGKLFESNPQSALGNLFGKNKTELQRSIRKLEALSGEKLLEPAKYNRYANILGMESGAKGPASITQLSTGLGTAGAGVPMMQALLNGSGQNIPAILAGGLGTMALGSPRVAAGLASTAKALEAPTRRASQKALQSSSKVLPILRQYNLSQQDRENR